MPPRKRPTLKQQNEALEKQKKETIKEITQLKQMLENKRMECYRENPLQGIKQTIDQMIEQSTMLKATLDENLIPQWQQQEALKVELQRALDEQRSKRLALQIEIDKQRNSGLCLCNWLTDEGESRVHSLPCGHLYCSGCIAEQMDNGSNECKQCKKPFARNEVWRVFYGESQ